LLDHWLAAHEFAVPPIRYNLASSTGPAWTLGELMALGGQAAQQLAAVRLSYAPPQGSRELRERIAQLYTVDPDWAVDPDWVVVTTGANEALLALYCLAADAGASIVLPSPMFPTMATLANVWGLRVSTYTLERASGFVQTADRVLAAVNDTTRLVLVNTPHNPTGSVMAPDELERLAAALEERGIPLLVDEVYHPLYFGVSAPSAAKLTNTLVVSDLSKALSLPGLRIGWIIDRDAARRAQLIEARSYFTVSGSPLTEALAAHALTHSAELLQRLDEVARANRTALVEFMNDHREQFGWIAPAGGPIAFPWRLDGRSSRPLCEALARAGVLFAPGDCFGAPEHFRIGFGAQSQGFAQALQIVARTMN
jgi:aspartate/methionine/tyrosine aminotransferase